MFGAMLRWFFILAGLAIVMGVLFAFAGDSMMTPAFSVRGIHVYWAILIGALVTYIGHRATK